MGAIFNSIIDNIGCSLSFFLIATKVSGHLIVLIRYLDLLASGIAIKCT